MQRAGAAALARGERRAAGELWRQHGQADPQWLRPQQSSVGGPERVTFTARTPPSRKKYRRPAGAPDSTRLSFKCRKPGGGPTGYVWVDVTIRPASEQPPAPAPAPQEPTAEELAAAAAAELAAAQAAAARREHARLQRWVGAGEKEIALQEVGAAAAGGSADEERKSLLSSAPAS